jgi:CRISPR-associated protein Cas1
LDTLLGFEGAAARTYFSNFNDILKPKGEEAMTAFNFSTRNRRPPTDPINAILSYVYAILIKDVTVVLQCTGFDPYLGFYHQPKYGRPALALDMAEEFRPLIGDSVVLTLVNKGEVDANDFIYRAGAVALSNRGRRKILAAYERRMDTLIIHPMFGYTISYRRVLEVQARLLGRYLLGEISYYPLFTTR